MPIAQKHDVAFILNDRPDLAARLGCDGVHIGQQDATYDEARAAMGRDRIVGVTCHGSRDLAFDAGEAGADYVAFGSFFPTTTKDVQFTAAEHRTAPVVGRDHDRPRRRHRRHHRGQRRATDPDRPSADFIAVSSGVWNYKEGAATAVREFNRLFAGF